MSRTRRWALRIAAGLAVLIILPLAVGAVLPVDHTATVRAELPAPPEEVWAVLADFAAHPSWREGVERMERLPDHEGRPAWREVSDFGAMDMVVEEASPPFRLVTRIIGEGQPFGGSWTFEVEPREGGSRVTVTERGEVYNAFFRFMSRFVFGHYGTMEAYLGSLGRRFGQEATETVRITS